MRPLEMILKYPCVCGYLRLFHTFVMTHRNKLQTVIIETYIEVMTYMILIMKKTRKQASSYDAMHIYSGYR